MKKPESLTFKKFIKIFLAVSLGLLLLCMGITILFDPFYQYHKPLPGLKAVLTDKEYQCISSLRTFDYDSVIVGSSVTENNDNSWFNQGFDCTTIKAVRSYGATADLCYLLDVAYETHELKNVFYNIDPSALCADLDTTYELTGCPTYLYDKNYFNDIEYLLNKSVLFKKIPYLIANSFIGDYDENKSYNWAQWKNFNEDMILGLYIRKPSVNEMKEKDYYQELLDGNLKMLTDQVEAHPDTDFYFFIPPYSMIWWDSIYRNGDTDAYLYNMEQAMKVLSNYDNVKFYCFLDDTEITTNLSNYMDILHFAPEVNEYICQEMILDNDRITPENADDVIQEMSDFSNTVENELILPYLDRIKVDTAEETSE